MNASAGPDGRRAVTIWRSTLRRRGQGCADAPSTGLPRPHWAAAGEALRSAVIGVRGPVRSPDPVDRDARAASRVRPRRRVLSPRRSRGRRGGAAHQPTRADVSDPGPGSGRQTNQARAIQRRRSPQDWHRRTSWCRGTGASRIHARANAGSATWFEVERRPAGCDQSSSSLLSCRCGNVRVARPTVRVTSQVPSGRRRESWRGSPIPRWTAGTT
jgi:hypothetical protein